jgi:hypothetical protein
MQPPIKEAVIALLDPDMLLLQPVSARVDSSTVLYSKGSDPTAGSRGYSSTAAAVRGTEPWVCEGHPVGQVNAVLTRSTLCSTCLNVLQLILLCTLASNALQLLQLCTIVAVVHHSSQKLISSDAAYCTLLLLHSLLHR